MKNNSREGGDKQAGGLIFWAASASVTGVEWRSSPKNRPAWAGCCWLLVLEGRGAGGRVSVGTY